MTIIHPNKFNWPWGPDAFGVPWVSLFGQIAKRKPCLVLFLLSLRMLLAIAQLVVIVDHRWQLPAGEQLEQLGRPEVGLADRWQVGSWAGSSCLALGLIHVLAPAVGQVNLQLNLAGKGPPAKGAVQLLGLATVPTYESTHFEFAGRFFKYVLGSILIFFLLLPRAFFFTFWEAVWATSTFFPTFSAGVHIPFC